jgi:hypothetical protein
LLRCKRWIIHQQFKGAFCHSEWKDDDWNLHSQKGSSSNRRSGCNVLVTL